MPLVQAQTYSGFERFIDNTKLFFSSGENKVALALEIKEKEVNSSLENAENGNLEDATTNLENAQTKLKLIQEKISLENAEKIQTTAQETAEKISENISDEFKEYKLEEEKTQLSAELTLKNFEYCKALSEEDYNLMLIDEKCNPENVSKEFKEEFQKLKEIQKEAFNKLMLEIRSCIDDPGTCDCENNLNISQKAKCEKMVALAVKCEYKDDEEACDELESMGPVEGDGFAESFVPDFLLNLFYEKKSMIDYNIEKSDVPEECYNENERVKTQCAVFRDKKELSSECFDDEGNFLVEKCGGPEENTPTMQESIPQCFDENNEFLTEKCGNVTIIWNEEGLINYIYEESLNRIIENFENASEQHTIEINGTEGQNKIREIKEQINQIEEQIAERTFAPGTYDTGQSGADIQNVVVENGNGENSGDDGLTPEVQTEVAGNKNSENQNSEIQIEIAGNSNGNNE